MMDKNLRYRIKRGYAVVRIGLTIEDAKTLRSALQGLHRSASAEPLLSDGTPLLAHVANLLDDAITQLEA